MEPIMKDTFVLLGSLLFLLGGIAGFWLARAKLPLMSSRIISPSVPIGENRPLDAYAFGRLKETVFNPLEIEFGETTASESGYVSRLFRFATREGWVSGQTNLPRNNEQSPVVVMLRGYVDKEEYQTGVGTKNAAAVFARNGYLTLAPDFLGFGSSDPEPENEIQSRLIRPASVLQLIASLANIPEADPNRIFLWGHSNGGQIALSLLEISGKPYPTTLWAPVSKPFPYSILYYTDELDDHGRYLRNLVSRFEEVYDADQFSTTAFYGWIQAPIQIHQGTADDSVPWKWSLDLTGELQKRGLDVALFQYPGTDHNLRPSWDTVIARDLEFFRKNLK